MIPLKWKFYRVLNYLLLCCGIIFLLHFLRLIIKGINLIKSGVDLNKMGIDLRFLNLSILFSLLFLFMASHGLINIIIMSKTFPDKILSRNKNKWHIVSLVLNSISLVGLIIAFFSLMSELDDNYFAGLLIIFATISVLMLSSMFVLICQFNLRKYLRQKNVLLMNSLVNSIGDNTENSE
jgi:hypothetical protein